MGNCCQSDCKCLDSCGCTTTIAPTVVVRCRQRHPASDYPPEGNCWQQLPPTITLRGNCCRNNYPNNYPNNYLLKATGACARTSKHSRVIGKLLRIECRINYLTSKYLTATITLADIVRFAGGISANEGNCWGNCWCTPTITLTGIVRFVQGISHTAGNCWGNCCQSGGKCLDSCWCTTAIAPTVLARVAQGIAHMAGNR